MVSIVSPCRTFPRFSYYLCKISHESSAIKQTERRQRIENRPWSTSCPAYGGEGRGQKSSRSAFLLFNMSSVAINKLYGNYQHSWPMCCRTNFFNWLFHFFIFLGIIRIILKLLLIKLLKKHHHLFSYVINLQFFIVFLSIKMHFSGKMLFVKYFALYFLAAKSNEQRLKNLTF